MLRMSDLGLERPESGQGGGRAPSGLACSEGLDPTAAPSLSRRTRGLPGALCLPPHVRLCAQVHHPPPASRARVPPQPLQDSSGLLSCPARTRPRASCCLSLSGQPGFSPKRGHLLCGQEWKAQATAANTGPVISRLHGRPWRGCPPHPFQGHGNGGSEQWRTFPRPHSRQAGTAGGGQCLRPPGGAGRGLGPGTWPGSGPSCFAPEQSPRQVSGQPRRK